MLPFPAERHRLLVRRSLLLAAIAILNSSLFFRSALFHPNRSHSAPALI
jgi:hypothetical protein